MYTCIISIQGPPRLLDAAQLRMAAASYEESALRRVLHPLLQPRVVGMPGHAAAQAVRGGERGAHRQADLRSRTARSSWQHIRQTLGELGAGWAIEEDTFTQSTPLGTKVFTNIVATFRPQVPSRLVLAAHYDSKFFDAKKHPETAEFIGATDSAAPCALLLDVARAVTPWLQAPAGALHSSLQLIFFDGEEAFVEWTARDSIYGSRHLAAKMASATVPGSLAVSDLQAIELFVLLDLLGAAAPAITSSFDDTNAVFLHTAAIEKRLAAAALWPGQAAAPAMFLPGRSPYGVVEDDHIPFLQRGVKILHVIPRPFPSAWHTAGDDASALDYPTLGRLALIFRVLVAELLHCPPNVIN